MQEKYLVLSQSELDKGFQRPVFRAYVHEGCNYSTVISQAIAETYARDPKFYGSTYCAKCLDHYPVDQFFWLDENGVSVGLRVGQ